LIVNRLQILAKMINWALQWVQSRPVWNLPFIPNC